MANQGDFGPSYADVDGYVQEVKGTYGHATRFEVVPPLWVGGEMKCGWIVRAVTWKNDGPRTVDVHAASVTYGGRSGCKTMPAAMYRCMFEIWNKYGDAQSEAERQAAF